MTEDYSNSSLQYNDAENCQRHLILIDEGASRHRASSVRRLQRLVNAGGSRLESGCKVEGELTGLDNVT